MTEDAVIEKMQSILQRWEQASDQRAVFLRCYLMMTTNMRAALRQGEFRDPDWVSRLLVNFAGYYFVALQAYDRDPASTPRVWYQAHQAAIDARGPTLQNLLLGVNAHINYDLVFSLVDLLSPDWQSLSPDQRQARYIDHCHVNEVIGCTIDAVQDQVIEPAMPVMDLLDHLLGSLDERLISALLRRWRENVWEYAVRLLEEPDALARARLRQEVEQQALKIGDLIQIRS
jgi:hypothetical protein